MKCHLADNQLTDIISQFANIPYINLNICLLLLLDLHEINERHSYN